MHYDQKKFILRMQGWFNIWTSNNEIGLVSKKGKAKSICSNECMQKATRENSTPIHKKNTMKWNEVKWKYLTKFKIKWNFLNLIRRIYKTSISNIIPNGKLLNTFSLRSGKRQLCPLSPSYSTWYWRSQPDQ